LREREEQKKKEQIEKGEYEEPINEDSAWRASKPSKPAGGPPVYSSSSSGGPPKFGNSKKPSAPV